MTHNRNSHSLQFHKIRNHLGAEDRGFALIISLVLLAFMVMLMLALSTLTNIETQAASRQQDTTEARQNALLAMSIAIGELQKYVGPDMRTTARANMDASLADNVSANGHWLGAYGRGTTANYDLPPDELAVNLNTNVQSNGSQAVLLNWLVSGNETTDFSVSRDVDPVDGRIVESPAAFSFSPEDPVDLNATSVEPSPNDTYALLVGDGSVAETSDRIAAPLVRFGDYNQGQNTVGRYAWWIGDEGAKARINLPEPDAADKSLAFVSAQRISIELMNRLEDRAEASDESRIADYEPEIKSLAKLQHTEQLPFLNTDRAEELSRTAKYRFHDITTHSQTVLVDAYAGGLKKDLSALLSPTATQPANDALLFTPSDQDTVLNPIGKTDYGVPTWGHLRSFATTQRQPNAALQPRVATDSNVGVAPVITYFEFGFELVAINSLNPASIYTPAVEGDEVGIAVYPKIVLWNPYTSPLAAQRYEITMLFRYGVGNLDIEVEDELGAYQPKARVFLNHGGAIKLYNDAGATPSPPPNDSLGMRFIVDVPDIPAGQSFLLSLNGSEGNAKRYEADLGQEPLNTLTHGLDITGRVLVRGSPPNMPVVGSSEAARNWRLSLAAYLPYGSGMGDIYLTPVGHGMANSDPTQREAYQAISQVDMLMDSSAEHPKDSVPLTRSKLVPDGGYWARARFTEDAVIRWLAQANPRAPIHQKMHTSNEVNGKNASRMFHSGRISRSYSNIQTEPEELRASSGKTLDSGIAIVDSTLFEFRPDNQPLLSLGQLQHANLSLLDVYPAYPFGNSYADYRFKSDDGSVRGWLNLRMLPDSNITYSANYMSDIYDVSWLLNYNLWDRYFLSTVPHAGTGQVSDDESTPIPNKLPNARNSIQAGFTENEIKQADTAAAAMLLEGGFNINSTSTQAWRGVLAGMNKLAYAPYNPSSESVDLLSALSRFAQPSNPESFSTSSKAWVGYRELNDEQIDALAAAIVEQVRLRGPFVSVADFVNRRLHDSRPARTPTDDLRLKGALQAAIDSLHADDNAVNPANPTDINDNPFNESMVNGQNSYGDVLPDEREDRLALIRGGGNQLPTASGAAMAPQFLTQADVLSAIGAGLTARSDTFVIRAYGEAQNALDGSITSRAWCEAIVQRKVEPVRRRSVDQSSPDYFEPALPTMDDPDFGRKFEVVSFRWLSPDDI